MPELVASLCTLLVLAPLALMPGLGEFLYRPMAAGVAFAMISAYILSRSFVPSRSARWLKPHTSHGHADENGSGNGDVENGHHDPFGAPPVADARRTARLGLVRRAFPRWESLIDSGIAWYVRQLERAMSFRLGVVLGAVALLVSLVVVLGPRLRREFFPEVDSGAFEIYARAPSGTRIEETEKRVARVEKFVRDQLGEDLQLIISEIGVVADLSAAYTPNAGPMDAVVKVQLKHEREHSAQEYVQRLRAALTRDPNFRDLEFAFDAGGMIRSAMNEGKSSPINIRLSGKNMAQARSIAEAIKREVVGIKGVVDARIIQRLDYPEYIIEVDRAKVADLGLNQAVVMKNVVAALTRASSFTRKTSGSTRSARTSTSSAFNTLKKTSIRSTPFSMCRSPVRARPSRFRYGTSRLCVHPRWRLRSRTPTSSRRST